MEKKPIVQVRNLTKIYNQGKSNEVIAINNISFDIFEGETFGLVGESGSGKSTTGKVLMRLEDMTSGSISFMDSEYKKRLTRSEMLDFRKNIQMIFQDPYASLNPRLTVKETIGGPLRVHKMIDSKKKLEEVVYDLLDKVGLSKNFASRYPKEFSGGQCQRIGIARALAVKPKFVIADEAISALDVSIQAQIVNLLRKLKQEENLTYLFIAHDLAMVKYVCNRIAVMHNGRILELASSDDIYHKPLHPYTESLLSAIPEPDPRTEKDRQRIAYNPSLCCFDEDKELGLVEIGPEHFVFCAKHEIDFYKEKYAKMTERS